MNASICQYAPAPMTTGPRHRIDNASPIEDSPYAPYLRRWLGRRAAGHRELLLNIAAASRIGLAPAGCGVGS